MADATGVGRRQRRAQQTRRRILDAARTEFLSAGYHATTIERIAELADVVPQTVYTGFGTKRQLLKTLVDYAVAGDEAPIATLDRPWVADALAAAPARQLAIHTRAVRHAWQRVAPMAKVARQAADIDQEMAELWQTAERQRRVVQHRLVTALLAKPGVRPHHDPDAVVDLVSFILGPESYWALVDQQGWPPERWQHHAYRLLAHYLLGDSQ